MTCPNCKHVYPIMNGIPNMVIITFLFYLRMFIRSLSSSFLPNTKLAEGIKYSDRARNTSCKVQHYHDGAQLLIRSLFTNDETL